MRRLTILFITIVLCFVLAGCATNASAAMYDASADYSSAVVSYLGPEGTYTQEACGLFFGKQGTYMPYETVHDAVEALVRGDTDYAVIPQENTIGGAVIDYVEELIAQSSVCVVGEVELPINQNLLVLPGSELGGIRKVYSHKQGITQGKAWMEQNIPQAEVIEVSSTAEGARMVAESKDPSCAAIASAACADVYGLEVLAAGIQNNESNRTRFYVLSKREPSSVTSERLAFIAKGSASDLPALMSVLDKAGASLVYVHDRPAKTVLGEYNYVIECSDLTYEEYLRLAGKTSFEIRYLGSFRCF